MPITLYPYQIDAVYRMKNGCVVCGGVGSGKSLTAISYYYLQNGGKLSSLKGDEYIPMNDSPMDLYIITTARKRDTFEWEKELAPFLLSTSKETNLYRNTVIVDSWNNVRKYADIRDAFFIFDEQRVVGSGVWVKSFLKIARYNKWILLSATPGDTWQDYIPVFIANGFYKNRREFDESHVVWDPYVKFPKVNRYLNTGRLIRLRNSILVTMDFNRNTVAHHNDLFVAYDIELYKSVTKTRTNPFKRVYIPCDSTDEGALLIGGDIQVDQVTPVPPEWNYSPEDGGYVKKVNEPISTVGELCYVWRKIVNSDESRHIAVLEIHEKHPKMIIFYNFDYELELLKNLGYSDGTEIAEWNGHKHQPIPDGNRWVYLVQYTAGAEGWNCIRTDTIVFYSQNYSYKVMVQASGRIDRLNTPFTDLYYYHLKSRSSIDIAIARALKEKKTFNEGKFVKW